MCSGHASDKLFQNNSGSFEQLFGGADRVVLLKHYLTKLKRNSSNLYISSRGFASLIREALMRVELSEFFSQIYDCEMSKRCAALDVCARESVEPGQILYVDDNIEWMPTGVWLYDISANVRDHGRGEATVESRERPFRMWGAGGLSRSNLKNIVHWARGVRDGPFVQQM
eukprot:gnl/Spiro4/12803_TR6783_c0_g1_i2.p1 gnl/Spiro4/12803_TR6783_c0_g1~~gnl/Spiro4/12803_TR6783_c0_g1_i2.p1  ORF type:complete len:170 (-),score=44.35 gnl/Spiro4/12803_TR6783_c0_g1_i2:49-558(-)